MTRAKYISPGLRITYYTEKVMGSRAFDNPARKAHWRGDCCLFTGFVIRHGFEIWPLVDLRGTVRVRRSSDLYTYVPDRAK